MEKRHTRETSSENSDVCAPRFHPALTVNDQNQSSLSALSRTYNLIQGSVSNMTISDESTESNFCQRTDDGPKDSSRKYFHGSHSEVETNAARNGMNDVIKRRCQFKSCQRLSTHGVLGGVPVACRAHRSKNMVDLKNKRCEKENCNKWPTYGYAGERSRFCLKHKSKGMVDVKNRRCEFESCNKRPTYGFEGERPKFCLAHKLKDMLDVRNRRCEMPKCLKRPTYGHLGGRPKYCLAHKKGSMVNVVLRKCADSNGGDNRYGFSEENFEYFSTDKDTKMARPVQSYDGYLVQENSSEDDTALKQELATASDQSSVEAMHNNPLQQIQNSSHLSRPNFQNQDCPSGAQIFNGHEADWHCNGSYIPPVNRNQFPNMIVDAAHVLHPTPPVPINLPGYPPIWHVAQPPFFNQYPYQPCPHIQVLKPVLNVSFSNMTHGAFVAPRNIYCPPNYLPLQPVIQIPKYPPVHTSQMHYVTAMPGEYGYHR